jgi:hypothetical protein
LPEGRSIGIPHWSNDGKKIAFTRYLDDRVDLWTADAATGKVQPIPGAQLNDLLSREIIWLRDNRHILATLVPHARGPAPAKPRAPI